MHMNKMNLEQATSEALKVIGAAGLLAAYAALAYWSHSDRTVANQQAYNIVNADHSIEHSV